MLASLPPPGNRRFLGGVSLELNIGIGIGLAGALAYGATPVAIGLANRLGFHDHPAGYKGHAQPTPYLGGAAVVGAFLLAVAVLGTQWDRTAPVMAGMALLWVVGTLDDRRNLSPEVRVAVETGVAAGAWALDLGWNLGWGPVVDLLVTVLWVVGVVNAFNLFDNMDGAATTMAVVVSGAVVVLGAVQGDAWVAGAAAALCGACAGFLPHNARSPARIFLGDGGSMPIGFGVAMLVMIGVSQSAAEWQALAMGVLFVGIPTLDTALVVVSRRRRGVPVLSGGRDHLTHRTRRRLATASAVAVALGSAQALLAVLAGLAERDGSGLLLVAVLAYLLVAGTTIGLADRAAEDATGEAGMRPAPRRGADPALALVAALGAGASASAFLQGLYAPTRWVPVALGAMTLLLALAVAGSVRLDRRVVAAPAALAGLALWSLLSRTWTTSPHQAVVEGNRWFLYAGLLAVLVVLVRTPRRAAALLGGALGGIAVVALYVLVRMAAFDGRDLFFYARLEVPLGYVNGQAALFVMGVMGCLALATARRRAPSSLAVGGMTLFAALVVLCQSRGAILSALVGAVLVLVLARERIRLLAAVVVAAVPLGIALPLLLRIYDRLGDDPARPAAAITTGVLRDAALATLAAAVISGGVWSALEPRLTALAPIAVGRRLAVALGVVAVLAVAAGAVRFAGDIDRGVSGFTQLSQADTSQASSRLLSGGGYRYDYWRVAVDGWAAHPVQGLGAGGYPVEYYRERRGPQDVRQPHSLPLQTLAELGLVGFALLLAFLGAIVAAIVRARRRAAGATADVVLLGAVGTFACWLVGTTVDWLHLIPGLTAVALAAAAALLHLGSDGEAAEPGRRPTGALRLAPAAGFAVVLIGASVLLSRQLMAERYADQARDALPADAALALHRADQSLRLDGSDVRTLFTKASAQARRNDGDGAERTLRRAARAEPENFVTYVLLGDLAVRRDEPGRPRAFYRQAQALNPRDPGLRARIARAGRALPGS
jgi:UDP-GlcNAc:undecaprenyl-phosphate GlcNAc-1-phosphate transferase